MSLLEMLQNRHSIRKYTDADISDKDLQTILQAGLLSASGRAARPWEFIVVRDKEMLQKMSESRVGAAKMLANANAAIVVIADESKTDVWVEDCSIAMSNMHLAASTLGIGSCWIQGRLRMTPDDPPLKIIYATCLVTRPITAWKQHFLWVCLQKKKRRPNCPRFLWIRFIMKNIKDYSFTTSI